MTDWLIQTAIETLVLGGVLLCVCRMFRFHPAIENLLWLVLLIKFMMPPVLHWPAVTLKAPEPVEQAVSLGSDEFREPALPAPALATLRRHEGGGPESATGLATNRRILDSAEPHHVLSTDLANLCQTIAWTIWLLGSGLLLIWQSFRIAAFHRRVSGGIRPENWLSEEVHRQAGRLQVPAPSIRIVAGLRCPLIWCLGRPKLCWPADLSDATAARGMIIHELAHLRRKDHLVVWLSLVAGFIWWWNPLFWLTRRRLVETADLCCDAWVTRLLPESRRSYAESLIALFERTSDRPRLASALSVVGGPTYRFERRMKMIMHSHLSPSRGRLSTAVALVAAAFVLPSWSQQVKDPRPESAAASDQRAEPGDDQELANAEEAEGGDLFAAPQAEGDPDNLFFTAEESNERRDQNVLEKPNQDVSDQFFPEKPNENRLRDATDERSNQWATRIFPLQHVPPNRMGVIVLKLLKYGVFVDEQGKPLRSFERPNPVASPGDEAKKIAKRLLEIDTSKMLMLAGDASALDEAEKLINSDAQMPRLTSDAQMPRLVPDDHTKSLIVRASPEQMAQIEKIVSVVDVPKDNEVTSLEGIETIRILRLRHRQPSWIGRLLRHLKMGVIILDRRHLRFDLNHGIVLHDGYGKYDKDEAKKIAKRLLEIDTSKMLMLAGDASALEEAEKLIKALDKPSQGTNEVPPVDEIGF